MLSNSIQIVDNKDVVSEFLNIYDDRFKRKFDMSILYNKLQSPSKIYYKIFNLNNDMIIVFFKKVQFIKTNYNRLLGMPISLNKDSKNERKVFNILRDRKAIKELVISEEECIRHNIDYKCLDVAEYDYFYNLKTLESRIDKGSWRSKKSITKYKDDLTIRFAKPSDYDGILEVHENWKKDKGEEFRSKNMFKKYFKTFYDNLDNTIVLQYKEKIIAYEVIDKFSDKFVTKIISNCLTSRGDYDIPKSISSNISKILMFYSMKLLIENGFDDYSFGGALSQSLLNFKRTYSTSEFKYYKIKL